MTFATLAPNGNSQPQRDSVANKILFNIEHSFLLDFPPECNYDQVEVLN